ncbi:hypothetical protein H6P81_001179 [Aristolochia fimbriata]|uniref:Uncharacterized protein n=1 Tax=Aristolochia fimbriata TaxID=158543 RepID=A0AAV7F9B8_ARIFI|nr:hypothetical protein H6P81_001179 [Aristolochia fimbriata]
MAHVGGPMRQSPRVQALDLEGRVEAGSWTHGLRDSWRRSWTPLLSSTSGSGCSAKVKKIPGPLRNSAAKGHVSLLPPTAPCSAPLNTSQYDRGKNNSSGRRCITGVERAGVGCERSCL